MTNKKKGFTLIELLVAILIVALVGTVGFISIRAVIDNSKEKSNALNISNIIKGARSYTEEFKTMDKYWFVDNETNEEYSCTTVGMLINKGFLKDSILDTVIDGKNVTRDTSIKIKRNKNTKVNDTEDILFNNINCDELADIKMEFDISGETGNLGWYIKDVNVKITVTNASQIDKDEEPSYVVKDDYGNVRDASVTSKENENGDNWQVKVGDEGRKLNLCVSIKNLKDKYQTYCLSDSNKEYNMDKTKPSTPSLTLDLSKNNYNIISNGSSDNVTSNSNLKYFINYDENLEEKEHSLGLGIRVTNKNVSTYVEDEAGNKSDTHVSTLNIIDSKNDTPTSRIEYYCSLDSNKYSNYNDAYSECNKTITGTVSPNVYYKCSLNNIEYSEENDVISNCVQQVIGTKSYTYGCNSGDTLSGSKCTSKYTIKGFVTTSCNCCSTGVCYGKDDYVGTYTPCDTGYSESYTCGSYSSCNGICENGTPTSASKSCTKTCSKSYSVSVTDCTCSISGKSCDNCFTTVQKSYEKIIKYFCNLNNEYYSTEVDAINNCKEQKVGTVSDKTLFKCSLDNKEYNSLNDANEACTNYCELGAFYSNDNSCYSLGER